MDTRETLAIREQARDLLITAYRQLEDTNKRAHDLARLGQLETVRLILRSERDILDVMAAALPVALLDVSTKLEPDTSTIEPAGFMVYEGDQQPETD